MLMVVLDFEIQWYFLASDYMDGSSNFDNTQCAEMCFFAKRTLMTGQTYYTTYYLFFQIHTILPISLYFLNSLL